MRVIAASRREFKRRFMQIPLPASITATTSAELPMTLFNAAIQFAWLRRLPCFANADDELEMEGEHMSDVSMVVNGRKVSGTVEDRTLLVHFCAKISA